MSGNNALQALRAQIDEIDHAVHDKLMARAALVTEIGALKGPGPVLRPAREAELIRGLVQRHQGPLPKRVLVNVWRELINGYSCLQGHHAVALFAAETGSPYWDLARTHFGRYVPMVAYRSVSQVLKAVSDQEVSVGVLPAPREDDRDIWWPHLVATGQRTPRIIARIPFTGMSARSATTAVEAVAVALIAAEESGDDISYVVFDIDAGVSRGRLLQTFSDHGLEPSFFALWQPPNHTGRAYMLVQFDGFVAAGDMRLQQLLLQQAQVFAWATPIGAYARPFDPDVWEEGNTA